MRVNVLGAGSWGTALSILLARNGAEVHLFGRDPEEIASLNSLHENLHYLPGFRLSDEITAGMISEPHLSPDFTVSAVPASSLRSVLMIPEVARAAAGRPLVLASKGLEVGSGKLMSEVVSEILPEVEVGALSGPNIALEVVRGIPTLAVAAFESEKTADLVRNAFSSSTFRVYRSDDVVGVELAGALKNVLAIAGGISDGLGFGDNTKGALLARGLREMLNLGNALEAKSETFLGIAGVGDLFATASSSLSRNYRVGHGIGSGRRLEDILREIGQVAEGVPTSEAISVLVRKHGVQAPILESVNQVLLGKLDPKKGVSLLMERQTPVESIPLKSYFGI